RLAADPRPNLAGAAPSPAARLAARAEEGRALALDDPSNRRAAGAAGLARAVVDPELIAIFARLVPQRAVHAERRAGARDRLLQHGGGLGGDRAPLGGAQRARAAPRIH